MEKRLPRNCSELVDEQVASFGGILGHRIDETNTYKHFRSYLRSVYEHPSLGAHFRYCR